MDVGSRERLEQVLELFPVQHFVYVSGFGFTLGVGYELVYV